MMNLLIFGPHIFVDRHQSARLAHVFEGRRVDMYRVLKLLVSNRVVTVRGFPAIGKTTFVREIGQHILRHQVCSLHSTQNPLSPS